MDKIIKEKIENLEYGIAVERTISQTLYELIMVEYSSVDVKNILFNKGIENISIYGMGRVGKALWELFSRNGISIVYCVDLNKNIELEGVDLRHDISAMTNDVDIVIVTPEILFDEIREKIQVFVKCPVMTAREIVENILLIPRTLKID